MDATLYETALQDKDMKAIMTDKVMLYANDLNSGIYNGTINIDCSQLISSGRWLAYHEGFIVIPHLLTMRAVRSSEGKDNIDIPGFYNKYMVGLKNSGLNLVESVSIWYNNKSVCQNQPLTGAFKQWEAQSKQSYDYYKKFGSNQFMILDDNNSTFYSNGYSDNDNGNKIVAPSGIINNNLTDGYTANAAINSLSFPSNSFKNTGFLNRLELVTNLNNGLNLILNQESATVEGYNSFQTFIDAKTRVVDNVWSQLVVIPLKVLSSFFDEMPLVKNGFIRIQLNYNKTFTQLTYKAEDAAPPTYVQLEPAQSVCTQTNGNICPYMISNPADPGADALSPWGTFLNPQYGLDDDKKWQQNENKVLTIENNIVSTSFGQSGTAVGLPLDTVRIYVPAYALNPIYEKQMLQEVPRRVISYYDFYTYQFTVSATASFNQVITNGIVKPKYLVVLPYLVQTEVFTSPAQTVDYQSIMYPAPGMTGFMAFISNYQVILNGKPVYNRNMQYNYDLYRDEVAQINALKGGSIDELTSGLISYDMWQKGYTSYVTNLSRSTESLDKPMGVTIAGINNCLYPVQYVCYLVYDKDLEIETFDSAIIRQS